jgi:integrase
MSVRRQKRVQGAREREFWIVDLEYRHPDGRVQRIRRVPRRQTRAAAEALERDILNALANKTYNMRQDMPTVAKFAEEFLSGYATRNKPSEQATKKRILEGHIIPALGKMALDAVGIEAIDKYAARKQRDGLGPKTINNHLRVLGKMLRCAADWKIIAIAPRIQALKEPEPEFDFLDFDEAERLTAACGGDLKTLVTFMVHTGLRHNEARALRWQDVDLVTGKMVVRLGVWKYEVGTPKGGRKRTIPLNAIALEVLKRHRHLRGERVFCREDGRMLGEKTHQKSLATACRRAGLRNVTWHVLRHTFGSHLAMRGVTIKTIQELMGHQSIEMTMRYAHLSPGNLVQATDLLVTARQPGGNAAQKGEKGQAI